MMKLPRQHDEKHLRFVRGLPCTICGNNVETQAAHVRFACGWAAKRNTGLGEKPDDRFTVPLCGKCHREQHDMNEREFWIQRGKDPVCIALALWANSGNQVLGERIALWDWNG